MSSINEYGRHQYSNYRGNIKYQMWDQLNYVAGIKYLRQGEVTGESQRGKKVKALKLPFLGDRDDYAIHLRRREEIERPYTEKPHINSAIEKETDEANKILG